MSLRRKRIRVAKPFNAAVAYDDAAIDNIIEAAGGLSPGKIVVDWDYDAAGKDRDHPARAALTSRLVTAGRILAIDGPKEAAPTNVEIRRILTSASNAATRLVKCLHIRHKYFDGLPLYLGPGHLWAIAALDASRVSQLRGYSHEMSGSDLLQESIEGLLRLERWLGALSNRERGRSNSLLKGGNRSPNRGSDALQDWIKSMREIWLDVFQRPDFHSHPFARFVSAASAPTPLKITCAQARELTRKQRRR